MTDGCAVGPCNDGLARIYAENLASVMELTKEINSIMANQ